ncbi:hypothetical protein BD626DRAFT_193 [Schizophyllum amplum]|uniref:Uncharacterized protein n=1 Tax=Schizophyllum amplum TaxID=97359 RepID=A0A550CVF2_9AGAR|nr:hypothetical protein BD626DRAFT_193 [Auriculariopsis ampla]
MHGEEGEGCTAEEGKGCTARRRSTNAPTAHVPLMGWERTVDAPTSVVVDSSTSVVVDAMPAPASTRKPAPASTRSGGDERDAPATSSGRAKEGVVSAVERLRLTFVRVYSYRHAPRHASSLKVRPLLAMCRLPLLATRRLPPPPEKISLADEKGRSSHSPCRGEESRCSPCVARGEGNDRRGGARQTYLE